MADLDRPWIDTPFLLQGFLLDEDEQIQQLRKHCEWVLIDPLRSIGKEFETAAKLARAASSPQTAREQSRQPDVVVVRTATPGAAQVRKPTTATKHTPARQPAPATNKPLTGEFAISISQRQVSDQNHLAPSATSRDAAKSTSRGVWANLRDGVAGLFAKKEAEKPEPETPTESTIASEEHRRPSFIPETVTLTIYEDEVEVEAEMEAATASFERSSDMLDRMAEDIRAGVGIKIENVEAVVNDMVESMVRNPDALMWVARMREQDLNIYGHGLAVAINLVAFGRHIGYPREDLANLGMLGLLLDVGKIKLPRELLEKNARLSADEFELIKDHVELGLDILKDTAKIHPDVLVGIAQHHERMNGSGYPESLLGAQITTFGRMSAIADTYAAVTKPRPYAEAISPHQALQMLSNWSGSQFQGDMVEQFIQSIGVFPVGSLVELSTGEVAVVVTHNKFKRLRPRVLILTEADKRICVNPRSLNLLFDVSERPVHIRSGLPSRAYGLDPRDFYAT